MLKDVLGEKCYLVNSQAPDLSRTAISSRDPFMTEAFPQHSLRDSLMTEVISLIPFLIIKLQ